MENKFYTTENAKEAQKAFENFMILRGYETKTKLWGEFASAIHDVNADKESSVRKCYYSTVGTQQTTTRERAELLAELTLVLDKYAEDYKPLPWGNPCCDITLHVVFKELKERSINRAKQELEGEDLQHYTEVAIEKKWYHNPSSFTNAR
jgi:hypothetical protein